MNNFSERFEIIYKTFFELAKAAGQQTSKLALSRLLGVSQGRLQHWENGQMPKAEDIQTLHIKLGLSYEWLLTGEGDPFQGGMATSPGMLQDLQAQLAAKEAENQNLRIELENALKVNQKLTAKLFLETAEDSDGGQENAG